MTFFLTALTDTVLWGTYVPKTAGARGMPSFTTVLQATDAAWRDHLARGRGPSGPLVDAVEARR